MNWLRRLLGFPSATPATQEVQATQTAGQPVAASPPPTALPEVTGILKDAGAKEVTFRVDESTFDTIDSLLADPRRVVGVAFVVPTNGAVDSNIKPESLQASIFSAMNPMMWEAMEAMHCRFGASWSSIDPDNWQRSVAEFAVELMQHKGDCSIVVQSLRRVNYATGDYGPNAVTMFIMIRVDNAGERRIVLSDLPLIPSVGKNFHVVMRREA